MKANWGWISFVFLYVVAANIPMWMSSRLIGIDLEGRFCIECVLAGLVALFVPRVLGVALLVAAIAADLLAEVSHTYYLPPSQCFLNMGSVTEFSATRLMAIGAVGVVIALLAVAAWRLTPAVAHGRTRRLAAVSLAVFIVALPAADLVKLSLIEGKIANPLHLGLQRLDIVSLRHYENQKLSSIATRQLIRDEVNLLRQQKSEAAASYGDATVASATAAGLRIEPILDTKLVHRRLNVVLVVVESWGLANDMQVRNALVAPYKDAQVQGKYRIVEGTVPFFGSTVPGEVRELCGNEMGFHVEDMSAKELGRCIPNELDALGYHTVAVHGMDGHMFRRSDWYPKVGFQEEKFRDYFRAHKFPSCPGAFRGTCDASIAGWIGSRLKAKGDMPEFIHWVTLNSHLPVPVPTRLKHPASCAVSGELEEAPALCSLYQLVANVQTSVAGLAMGDLGRPTMFMVVGDHAPPFASEDLREEFSQSVVPYVLLLPRDLTQMTESGR